MEFLNVARTKINNISYQFFHSTPLTISFFIKPISLVIQSVITNVSFSPFYVNAITECMLKHADLYILPWILKIALFAQQRRHHSV